MFSGKTLAQALTLVIANATHAQAFYAYVQASKAHKARWVRAAAALKAGDMARVRAYAAESGDARKDAWKAVKAKEAKPAQVKPAPVKAKAPAKQPKAKPAPAQAKPAIDPALVEAVAQAVLAALQAQAKGKKVA